MATAPPDFLSTQDSQVRSDSPLRRILLVSRTLWVRCGRSDVSRMTVFLAMSFAVHALALTLILPWQQKLKVQGDTLSLDWISTNSAEPSRPKFQKKRVDPTQPLLKTTNESVLTAKAPQTESTNISPSSTENSEPIHGSDVGIEVTYPKLSRILGEEGRVLVKIEGSGPKLISTSGHERLDKAVLDTIRTVQSTNTKLATGQSLAFIFRLK